MAEYLDTSVAGTDAPGLYQSPQNVGNATIFDTPTLTADKVLQYAIENGERQRKKSDKSIADMNDALNKIKIEGYIHDQQELQKEADEAIKAATDFGVKYKRGYQDYQASDPVQAKDYMEIQKKLNRLEYDKQVSMNFQKWVSMVDQKKNALTATGGKVRASSSDEVNRIMRMPLSERAKYLEEKGGLPDLDPQYDYPKEGAKMGELLNADLKVVETREGRIITNKNKRDSEVIQQKLNETAYSLLGAEGKPDRAVNWAQQLLEDEIENNPDLTPQQNYQNALTKVKHLVQNGMEVQYKSVYSPLAISEEKEKADVRIVPVEETMETPSYSLFRDEDTTYEVSEKAILTPKDPQKLRTVISNEQLYKISPRSEGAAKKLVPAPKGVEFATVPTIIHTDNGDFVELTRKEPTFIKVTKPQAVETKKLFEYYPEMVDDYTAADTKGKEDIVNSLRQRLAEDGGVTRDETVVYRKKIDTELKGRLEPLIKGGYPQWGVKKSEVKTTQPTKKGTTLQKTVVKKGYNATTNKTQLIYSDGTKEIVDGKR